MLLLSGAMSSLFKFRDEVFTSTEVAILDQLIELKASDCNLALTVTPDIETVVEKLMRVRCLTGTPLLRLEAMHPQYQDWRIDEATALAIKSSGTIGQKEDQGTSSSDPIEFPFMKLPDFKALAERDYSELMRLNPFSSPKSVTILCGSVIECILFDLLIDDGRNAMTAINAPLKRGGAIKDITLNNRQNQWSLSDLIKVACELGHLDDRFESLFHVAVREFRNYVHPRAEIDDRFELNESLARSAVAALDQAIDQLR